MSTAPPDLTPASLPDWAKAPSVRIFGVIGLVAAAAYLQFLAPAPSATATATNHGLAVTLLGLAWKAYLEGTKMHVVTEQGKVQIAQNEQIIATQTQVAEDLARGSRDGL